MYHYTYIIQHKAENMSYIGVRTSKVPPNEDITYWGSSKYLPSNISEVARKVILRIHNTREQALRHEVYLHQMYDVARNPVFWNRSKQLITTFDCTGVPVSADTRKLQSKVQKRLAAQVGYVNPRKGTTLTEQTKAKVSTSVKASIVRRGRAKAAPRFSPWFIMRDTYTEVMYDETQQEYSERTGIPRSSIASAMLRSNGTYRLGKYTTSSVFDGCILGHIPDIGVVTESKPLLKHPWFITRDSYSEVFYVESSSSYERRMGLRKGLIGDSIYISKGSTPLKRGVLRGCIVGRINKVKI